MNELFDTGPQQLGLDLGDAKTTQTYEPDRDEIRAELIGILEVARSARNESPWDQRTFLYHKVVFPQMAQWLSESERDQLCFEFAREAQRIELLMAA
ncbi:MAG TPA: hypothetical protein VJM81_02460 [Rhizorhapis sp.]|nr:hypothetical protein [Rhizorhapis sp.]